MLTIGDEEGGTERKLIDRKHKQNGFVTSKLLRLIFSPIHGYSSFAIHLNKWIGSIHFILHLESNRKICLRIHDLITSYNCISWFNVLVTLLLFLVLLIGCIHIFK